MRILVIGGSYVGLTTGVALAYLGHDVTCLDTDDRKVEELRAGRVPFYEPHLQTLFDQSRTRLRFLRDYSEAVPNSDVIFIGVGTPPASDGSADLRQVRAAAMGVGAYLGQHFTLVVNKSTVPIGSVDWVEALIRGESSSRNQRSNASVAVASNPEFLREGSALHDTLYPERVVVGAAEPRALEMLATLYRPILEQSFLPPRVLPRPEGLAAVPLIATDIASAELIKYAANAFLAMKVSFINEVSELAERVGADVSQVARGIGLDSRIGNRFLQAGIGWGGSCFGKDTAALVAIAESLGVDLALVRAARTVNYRQRERVVGKLIEEWGIGQGSTVGLLGLAFKPDTDDIRDSPAIDVAQRLLALGVQVKAHDPVALERARYELPELGVYYCDDAAEVARDSDALVLVTDWPHYQDLAWAGLARSMRSARILDARNALDRAALEYVGFRYAGTGSGS